MATLLSLRLLCLVAVVAAEPAPGRIPKVYNALITSNQNLEPSKAFPVYQPVLHDTLPFPLQPPVFFGDFPVITGIRRIQILTKAPAAPKSKEPAEKPSSPEEPPSSESTEKPKNEKTPPEAPVTVSPIPLSVFGLPPQVLPLGRLDPGYQGFSQLGPFSYSYPSFRFYDPFDPFNLTPYASLPTVYRPLSNIIGQTVVLAKKEAAPTTAPQPPTEKTAEAPPPEPSDLNMLNFSSKDPAIPNVPPPPLPQGGLKSDSSE